MFGAPLFNPDVLGGGGVAVEAESEQAVRDASAGPLIELLDLKLNDVSGTGVAGYHFDRPPQTESRYDMAVWGWVVGRDTELTSVHVQIVGGPILQHIGLWPRPDVLKAFGGNALAERAEFLGVINMLSLPPEVELAVWACGKKAKPIAELCRFRVRLRFPKVPVEGSLTPVMVCTVGRSGSTVLLRGLWEHPEFAVHPVYPYENHYFQYCLHAARVQAGSCISPREEYNNKFYLSQASETCPYNNRMPDLDEWFIHRHVPQTLRHWLTEGMAFYHHCANKAGKGGVRFFVEKSTVHNPDLGVMENAGIDPKLLLLVRDPRDVAASWMKFLAKSRGQSMATVARETEPAAFCRHVEHLAEMFRDIVKYNERRAGRVLWVRYEDLMREPQRVVGEILGFCGADGSEEMVRRVVDGLRQDDDTLKAHRTTANPQASMGAWRRDLLPWQQAFCVEKLGEVSRRMGYGE